MVFGKLRDQGGRRRSAIDRRQASISIDFPDRRSDEDRRGGVDRRSGSDRRNQKGFRIIAGLGRRFRSGEKLLIAGGAWDLVS